jgi:hypothetical protein
MAVYSPLPELVSVESANLNSTLVGCSDILYGLPKKMKFFNGPSLGLEGNGSLEDLKQIENTRHGGWQGEAKPGLG